MLQPPAGHDWTALTHRPIPLDALSEWAVVPRAGAVVAFTGVVRDHAEGRPDVVGMTYEAYEGPAAQILADIAEEARRRWPDVARIAIVHRIGELALSDASVVVVVSAPHRDVAFAAARFGIDTVKESAPIWKREHRADGSDWGLGTHDISPVGTRGHASDPAGAFIAEAR